MDAGKDAEQRRFSGAVPANNAEAFALRDDERHVIKHFARRSPSP